MNLEILTSTEITFGPVAHNGKMWLAAGTTFDTPAGELLVKGRIRESCLAPVMRWNKLAPAEQEKLVRRVTTELRDALQHIVLDARAAVEAYLGTCADEGLEPGIARLKTSWASGFLDLDDYGLELESILTELRVLKRQTEMATQVAQAVKLADYPSTFDAAYRSRKLIAVLGPTNSGKTYDAFNRLAQAESGVYLGPLRLLALEAFTRLNTEFGVSTSLVTGEERREIAGSKVTASTIEMLDTSTPVDVAIIDEIQMLNDPDRGWAWTQAVVGANAGEVWVLGALSAEPAIRALAKRLGLPLEVRYKTRKHPLIVGQPLGKSAAAALHHAEPGDAFIVFSRRDALNLRDDLLQHKRTVACIYGALSPEVRESEARRFASGEAEILVATDAIGLGLNLPISRCVFTAVQKYDGVDRSELSVPLLQQIGGRAGRFGIAEAAGRVVGVTAQEHVVVERLMRCKQEPLPASGFQIGASSEYLQTMVGLTGETRLEALLSYFSKHADRGDGFFRPHVPEEQLKRAAELDALTGMPLADKLIFSMAPMSAQSPALDATWRDWAKAVSRGREVTVDFLSSNPRMADLEEAEDAVRLLSTYRWFAFRLPDVFVDLERADKLLPGWTRVVDAHLKSKHQQGIGGRKGGDPSWYWGMKAA